MTTDFILGPGEYFIECPYESSHRITNARINTHLEKCRKAFAKSLAKEGRELSMKICRFNALHHYPAPEIKIHEDRCPDAFSVVRHISYHNSAEGTKNYEERRKQDSSNSRRRSPSPSTSSSRRHSHSNHRRDKEKIETKPPQTTDWGLEEEDWEADCAGDVPGYDPELKLKSEVVIQNPPGLTKSERKKFRNEVREKAAEKSLKGEPVEFPTANSFDIKPDIKPDMKGLKIEVGRNSPLEPGEIDDDDVDNKTSKTTRDDGSNGSHSRSRDGDHRRDVKYERRESHSDRRERDVKYDPRDSHSDRRDSHSDRRDSYSHRRDSHSDRRDSHSDRRDSHSSRHDSHSDRRDNHYERRDSRDDRTSSTSRPRASSSKSSYSKSVNSSATKTTHVDDGPYSDNDDFAGHDPYA